MSKTFKEYLDSKGKLAEPVVKVVADKVDMPKGRDKMPPKAVGMKKSGKGYKQPQVEGDKKFKAGKSEALGDMTPDKNLLYDVTKETKPAKIPTAESFVYVFPKVRSLLSDNPALVEHLVRELKSNGLLALLVAELAGHNETFGHLAEIMADKSHGRTFCNKLVRAIREDIREDIAPPFGHPHHTGGEDEEGMFGGGEHPGFGDDGMGIGGDEMPPEEPTDIPPEGEGDVDPITGEPVDPNAPPPEGDPNDPNADPMMDPNAPPPEGEIDPLTGKPKAPAMPPMPTALEHLRRAMRLLA